MNLLRPNLSSIVNRVEEEVEYMKNAIQLSSFLYFLCTITILLKWQGNIDLLKFVVPLFER